MPKMAIAIEITPQPVVVGQPWHVKITGLRKNQDNILLGNGWDDGNFMLTTEFAADANGVLEIHPPPLSGSDQVPAPSGTLTFNVLQLLGGGNTKVLATQDYQVSG